MARSRGLLAGLLTVAAAVSGGFPPAQAAPTAQVMPALVDIDTALSYQSATGAGTGILLTSGGEVLTNNHVVEGATSITATNVGNGRTYPVDVIGYDRNHDIALLQLRGATDLATAPLGDSSVVAVGDSIVGLGNAGGGGGTPSSAPGTVIGLNQTVTASDDASGSTRQLTGLIQVAADIRPGDSGGALVNTAGQVIGIDTAATPGYKMGSRGGQGFAIPIGQALPIADQIRAGSGSVHIGGTAFLGVGVSDGRSREPSSVPGAFVQRLLAGGPADQLGLTDGDLIVSVDSNPVDSATTLTDVFDQHHPGDKVVLGWLDGSGRQHTQTVTLVAGPVG
jgi:S1-C subfamily serine protease